MSKLHIPESIISTPDTAPHFAFSLHHAGLENVRFCFLKLMESGNLHCPPVSSLAGTKMLSCHYSVLASIAWSVLKIKQILSVAWQQLVHEPQADIESKSAVNKPYQVLWQQYYCIIAYLCRVIIKYRLLWCYQLFPRRGLCLHGNECDGKCWQAALLSKSYQIRRRVQETSTPDSSFPQNDSI